MLIMCHKSWNCPSRKKFGDQKHDTFGGFWCLWDLIANTFGTKHDVHNRARTSETTRGPLHCLKLHELRPTNGLKGDGHFHPPSINSAFYFIPTQTLANRTQPNFTTCWVVNWLCKCMSKVREVHCQKNGELKSAYLVTVLILIELCQMLKNRAGVFTHLL